MKSNAEKSRKELYADIASLKKQLRDERASFKSYRNRVFRTFFQEKMEKLDLSEREENMFLKYWGFKDMDVTATKDLAEEWGTAISRVSQLTLGVLKKLFEDDGGTAAPTVKRKYTRRNGKVKIISAAEVPEDMAVEDMVSEEPEEEPVSFEDLEPGDLLTTESGDYVKVLNASGEGESRIYGISFQASNLDSDNLKRFADFCNPMDLRFKGLNIVNS